MASGTRERAGDSRSKFLLPRAQLPARSRVPLAQKFLAGARMITLLRWLAVALVLRVTATILSNYPDYFPPNFDSLFLEGRERTFAGAYRVAFYVHIVAAPFALLAGLVLLSDSSRRKRFHRALGRVQVCVLLVLVVPSSVAMSRFAFGGWPAGLSFALLSVLTAICAIAGVVCARRKRFDRHRRWMHRTFVLLCSAVALRLLSGAASLLEVANPERAYVVASWCSWLLPLAVYEVAVRRRAK
jgi:uncharacterized membrane protein